MKQSRVQLLKQVYEHEQNNSSPLTIAATMVNKFDISFLESKGYLEQPMKSIGAYHLSLTDKGENFVTNGFVPETTTPSNATFNFNNTTFENSVVGTGISGTHYTINTATNFSELKELINTKPALEQEQLNELLSILQSIQESNDPIKKGILFRFSNLLEKYSDLATSVGKILLGIFSGGE